MNQSDYEYKDVVYAYTRTLQFIDSTEELIQEDFYDILNCNSTRTFVIYASQLIDDYRDLIVLKNRKKELKEKIDCLENQRK